MLISFLIKEPAPFYSYLDEENFFRWLKSIPAVKGIVRVAQGMEIKMESPLSEPNLRDLIAIMTRYDIDMKDLRRFCDLTNEKWFKNRSSYWFKAVFDD